MDQESILLRINESKKITDFLEEGKSNCGNENTAAKNEVFGCMLCMIRGTNFSILSQILQHIF